jgi:hypothetical protein
VLIHDRESLWFADSLSGLRCLRGLRGKSDLELLTALDAFFLANAGGISHCRSPVIDGNKLPINVSMLGWAVIHTCRSLPRKGLSNRRKRAAMRWQEKLEFCANLFPVRAV